jgi:penicillin-binding protein 2
MSAVMNPKSKHFKPTVLATTLLALATLLSTSISATATSRKSKEDDVKTSSKTKKNQIESKSIVTGRNSKEANASKKRPAPEERSRSTAKLTEKNRNSSRGIEPTSKRNTAQAANHKKDPARREDVVRRTEPAPAKATRERAEEDTLRDDVQEMIAGDDLSGEDPEIRRVAVSALGNHAGTVVVMDPKTGRVYSMVNQKWAVREGFKPCSTIKLITALAGLNEDVIDPDDTTNISDSNDVSLTKALAYSKNEYFQQVGGQVGFEKMLSYARQLGLGEKTGINMRNESAGRIPDARSRPGIARMSSHGDDFQVTALQLATLVSAMSNGGKLVTPYVVRSHQDELRAKTRIRRQIRLNPEAWKTMVPGMVGAVNYGSGNRARDPKQTVAGKTGTCIERGGWVGLFTSYAPLTNPKLAVVVITRGADAHNHFPAAVAGRIYRDLNGRTTTTNAQLAAARGFSNDDVTEMSNRTQLARRSSNVPVRPVLMQVPRRYVEPAKPQIDPVEQGGADGQTRPRRVNTL